MNDDTVVESIVKAGAVLEIAQELVELHGWHNAQSLIEHRFGIEVCEAMVALVMMCCPLPELPVDEREPEHTLGS
jgi:hypothetical protein